MGDLTKNLSKIEFCCQDGCGYCDVQMELVYVLQDLRDHFGRPLIVNSGCRCVSHNRIEGGSPVSQHIYGKAADIQIPGVTPYEIYQFLILRYPNSKGIGLYSNWVHIDIRKKKARW